MNFRGLEICCPKCREDLAAEGDPGAASGSVLRCVACGFEGPVVAGIPDLRVFDDPYISIEDDRAKAVKLATWLDGSSFEELVQKYYATTDVVPAKDAQRYTQGLMAAPARAAASLAAWDARAAALDTARGERPGDSGARLLEIGCGTAPLLIAAEDRVARAVGVDIALRWLVVGKKRLEEAALDAPLICACAEALPFPDEQFELIVAESTIEHLRDQRTALREARRVAAGDARLYLSTPNRRSLGPDPHVPGAWAGGWWPKKRLDAFVTRRGGIPPKRHLLTPTSLRRLLQASGFVAPVVFLPEIPESQRRHYGALLRFLVGVYGTVSKLPGFRQFLLGFGPLFMAVSKAAPRSN